MDVRHMSEDEQLLASEVLCRLRGREAAAQSITGESKCQTPSRWSDPFEALAIVGLILIMELIWVAGKTLIECWCGACRLARWIERGLIRGG